MKPNRDSASDGKEILLSGTIIAGEEFEAIDGYICIKKGLITEIGEGRVESQYDGLICPLFINAHTHIGDSILKDPPYAPLEDLVGPCGLKHKILEKTPQKDLEYAMRKTVKGMIKSGTCAFADFREGGNDGVLTIQRAINGLPIIARIFGRPGPHDVLPKVHTSCFGLGISSTRDFSLDRATFMAQCARKDGKLIAIHAGEAGRDDIDDALELDPDILVHLTHATLQDLEKVRDLDAGVVICPRSNLVTSVGLPDLAAMIRVGLTVAVGTDNVMLNSTNMFREMEYISKALLHDDRQVFKMCTLSGARLLRIDKRVGSISIGKEARVMVIDKRSINMAGYVDPISSIVRRAEPTDIMAVF